MMRIPSALIGLLIFILIPSAGLSATFHQFGGGLFPSTVILPRHAGKPDPRWREFDWKYTDRRSGPVHYRLYYYEEEDWVARAVIPVIDQQVLQLSRIFDHKPRKRFDYLVFTSLQEFQQANIFYISEGVRGITSTEDVTMAVPYQGDREDFRHVSEHELVHQFQIQKVRDRADLFSDLLLAVTPLWFIEGMAEFYSLGGMDPPSEYYLRDLLLHPDKKEKYIMPAFFSDGPLTFVTVYKAGQAKIDFLESEFGTGTAQDVFDELIRRAPELQRSEKDYFKRVVTQTLDYSEEAIQEKWKSYLDNKFLKPAQKQRQSIKDLKRIKDAGENLDDFAVSPDGSFILLREIDPDTGIAWISAIDRRTGDKQRVVRNYTTGVTSLYFMQFPTLAVSENYLLYLALTPYGPELEYRIWRRDSHDRLVIENRKRIRLHEWDILQAESPTISGAQVAFSGLGAQGWQDIYLLDLSKHNPRPRRVTKDPYAWKHLQWEQTPNGVSARYLLASSDQTETGSFNIFLVDTVSGEIENLAPSPFDRYWPSGHRSDFFFQSWETGSSQVHRWNSEGNTLMTEVTTALVHPRRTESGLLGLGFRKGRFHLYEVPENKWIHETLYEREVASLTGFSVWRPELIPPGQISENEYRPFLTSGWRVDQIMGFFGSGGVGGLFLHASDLMRDHRIQAFVNSPGSSNYFSTSVLWTNHRGRSTWGLGAYYNVEPRIDPTATDQDGFLEIYRAREVGIMGSWRYPLGAFSYFELGARVADVGRSDFSAGSRSALITEAGSETLIAPMVRLGYDQILYSMYLGPFTGFSFLMEYQSELFSQLAEGNQNIRLDVAYYLPVFTNTILAFQTLAGTSLGGPLRHTFYLSGSDILRAYPWGDRRLLGNHALAAKAEWRLPVGTWIGFPILLGLVGYDYGVVTSEWDQADESIASSYSTGLSLNLMPLTFHFIGARPIQTAPGPDPGDWVYHFYLRYMY